MIVRIAQIRVYPISKDLGANHSRLMEVLSTLAEYKPDVVITPEGFLDGYVGKDPTVTTDTIRQYAIEPATSAYARSVSDWAAANRSWIVFGCARAVPEGVYNSALIYNRDGELIGIYDKTHIQSHDKKYLPGQSLPVFSSDFGPFGVMICADRRWPETVRTLALKGARVIFNPTYGNHSERNLHMMQTRSYESEVFIAFTHPAQSLITGPEGEIIVNECSEGKGFSITEIDLTKVDERRAWPTSHLAYRRTDLYL